MSTMPITLSTYNSANMHVNDVNMQYAEVVGTCLLEPQASGSLEPLLSNTAESMAEYRFAVAATSEFSTQD